MTRKEEAPQKPDATGIEKVIFDVFNYGQDGWQQLGFIVSLAGFGSIFYIAIKPQMSYPEFTLLFVAISIPAFAGAGYFVQRIIRLVSHGTKIAAESTAYAWWKLTPLGKMQTISAVRFYRGLKAGPDVVEPLEWILRRNGISSLDDENRFVDEMEKGKGPKS